MKFFFTFTLLCSAFFVSAQKAPIKFGDVSLADLQLKSYDQDSFASAVFLADYGSSTIAYTQNAGFSLTFERTFRIKIFKKEGFDWADFEIPLYNSGSDREKLTGLKAITYNLEGGKIIETKIKNDAIFEERTNENWQLTKLTFPNVKEGSVLEITYKVHSPFMFNFQDWQFQHQIPVVWSEYRATIPEYYNYERYLQGYVALSVVETSESNNTITFMSSDRDDFTGAVRGTNVDKVTYVDKRFRWAAQNVPAFKMEPYMTTYMDYISKIHFELSYYKFPNQPIKPVMGSWEEINARYAESADCGGQVKGNGFLGKIVEEITAGLTTDEQKIAAIDAYVKGSIAWDGSSRKFTDASMRKVLDEKKGSSAEINLILASMLEKANFQVSPVLISTRDHGFVRETVPVSSQFNYVICQVEVGGKKILMDGTDGLLPTGVLPERCLNGNGLVISKNGYAWVKLASSLKSRQLISASVDLTKDGGMTGKLQYDRTGYFARDGRKKYLLKGEPDYIKEFLNGKTWQLGKSSFSNTRDISQVFKEEHELEIADHTTASSDVIYLNPFVVSRIEENPFKLETREFPVDFGSASDRTYMLKVTIPEGFTVYEIPQSKMLVLPENGARYIYNVARIDNTITLTRTLQINKSIFTQDQYGALREFYNQVVAKEAEQIVLKKK